MPQPLLTRPPSPLTAQSLQVYLALWHETEVACKVLLAGGSAGITSSGDAARALALSSPIMHQLEEEAGLLAALRHPNVIQFCESLLLPPLLPMKVLLQCCCTGPLLLPEGATISQGMQRGKHRLPWPHLLSCWFLPPRCSWHLPPAALLHHRWAPKVAAVAWCGLCTALDCQYTGTLLAKWYCRHRSAAATHAAMYLTLLMQQSTVLAAACTRC